MRGAHGVLEYWSNVGTAHGAENMEQKREKILISDSCLLNACFIPYLKPPITYPNNNRGEYYGKFKRHTTHCLGRT